MNANTVKPKVVIIISGSWDKGKTGSIIGIYEKLCAKYTSTYKVVDEFTESNNHKTGEVKKIIEIGGVRIGIESEGDPGSRLTEELLGDFFNAKCDLIICAARNGLSKPECKPLIAILNELQTNRPEYQVISTSNYEDLSTKNELYHQKLNDRFSGAIIDLITDLYPDL